MCDMKLARVGVWLLGALMGALMVSRPVSATVVQDAGSVDQAKVDAIQAQIDALQKEVDALKKHKAQAPAAQPAASEQPKNLIEQVTEKTTNLITTHTKDTGITIGGAVRFQYAAGPYDSGNNRRKGDLSFDTFRLDLNGEVHGILLSAEWRWYSYMQTMEHAWVGYNFFDNTSQVQFGITQLPFGVLPYDSHSFFFGVNYYVGLEQAFPFGLKYQYKDGPWNAQVAFFKNDNTGGVNGASFATFDSRIQSYTFNVVGVRAPGDGNFAPPGAGNDAGTVNTGAARLTYDFQPLKDLSIVAGVSGLYGGLEGQLGGSNDRTFRLGHYYAAAAHANVNYQRWNLQLQATRYAYRTNDNAPILVAGGFNFYTNMPAKANTYTANVAYTLPVHWGPVQSLQFYNDYGIIVGKSGGLHNSVLNDTGVGITAGPLFTWLDFVTARNMPYVGGSLGDPNAPNGMHHRYNMLMGFYF